MSRKRTEKFPVWEKQMKTGRKFSCPHLKYCIRNKYYITIPAATVSLVASSTSIKLPVPRLSL